jgi:hypothetical protein
MFIWELIAQDMNGHTGGCRETHKMLVCDGILYLVTYYDSENKVISSTMTHVQDRV